MQKRKLRKDYSVRFDNRTYRDDYNLLKSKGYVPGDQIEFNYMERTQVVLLDTDKLVIYKNGYNFVCYMHWIGK